MYPEKEFKKEEVPYDQIRKIVGEVLEKCDVKLECFSKQITSDDGIIAFTLVSCIMLATGIWKCSVEIETMYIFCRSFIDKECDSDEANTASSDSKTLKQDVDEMPVIPRQVSYLPGQEDFSDAKKFNLKYHKHSRKDAQERTERRLSAQSDEYMELG